MCLIALLAPLTSAAHPLHTSLTRISAAADGSVTVTIRAFSDDFSAAVARATKTAATADYRVADEAAAEYLSETIGIIVGGERIELSLTSQRRDGDVTWIELRGECRGSLDNALILNRVLMEFHRDQVNIVRVTGRGVPRTMLFSAGDGAKRLR